MKCRSILFSAAMITPLVGAPLPTSAQVVSVEVSTETVEARTANLAFSKDGRKLREVQAVGVAAGRASQRVRAITYDATTGSIRHVLTLDPGTDFSSATPDGRTAIISVDRDRNDAHARLLLIDMETGKAQNFPPEWFDTGDTNPYAQISADGRLVSAFTASGPESGPLVVTLYDWRTKKPIAEQSTGYPAGGFSWGGVTADGKIEFLNNRVGGEIVDPKNGRLLLRIGPNSHRSSDGAWVVDFPNPMYDEVPQKVVISNGSNGELVGKLDLQIADDQENWGSGRGALCGTSGRFIAATYDTVQAFEIPSGTKIADFPKSTWQDADAMKTNPAIAIACSSNGRRVAIRSGARLTLHNLN
jgi:hypothetical protein